MSVLPSFSWPDPQLVSLLGVEYVSERLKVVTDGYAQLCDAVKWGDNGWVNPMSAMTDEEVLAVVSERRDRRAYGQSTLGLRAAKRQSEALAEHGEAEVAEFERWVGAKRAAAGRRAHLQPAVVESRARVMEERNKLELDLVKRVQKAVDDRELELSEAMEIASLRVEASRVDRAMGGRVSRRAVKRAAAAEKPVAVAAPAVQQKRVVRNVSAVHSRGFGRVPTESSLAETNRIIADVEARLESLRSLVRSLRDVDPGMDYIDAGDCSSYADNW